MVKIRRGTERGHADHGWLTTYHTFSFANYYDPRYMGFRSLRVINDDKIAGGHGFGTHPHRNMEIISYVVSGALEHKDSMGNGSVLHPDEFQIISAGRGITHSEFNPLQNEATHLYQIWIEPSQKGLEPRYYQRKFPRRDETALQLIAGPADEVEEPTLPIHQDARLYRVFMKADTSLAIPLRPDRYGWLHTILGEVKIGDTVLSTNDAAAFEQEEAPLLHAEVDSELLFFDLA